MNELVKVVINDKQEQVVSARELHEKLGIKERFSAWFDRVKYHMEEEIDYCRTTYTNNNNQEFEDYVVNIDSAKHLSMISGGEKAHEIRKYFIQIEKAWNDPTLVMARSLQYAQSMMLEYQSKIELMQPKVDFYDDVVDSKDAIEVGEVAKVLNCGIGRNRLFEFLRDNGVLMQNNTPYQSYVDRGWFRLVESKYTKPNGDIHINIKTVVFQKGVDGIRKLLKG